jgi:hypothetical protein
MEENKNKRVLITGVASFGSHLGDNPSHYTVLPWIIYYHRRYEKY